MDVIQDANTGLHATQAQKNNEAGNNYPAARDAQGLPVKAAGYPTAREIISQPLVRKSLPAISVLMVLVVLLMLFLWINGGEYRTLYPDMSEVDRSESMEALIAATIPVQLDSTSGALSVPVDRYYDARMALASAGLPRDANTGSLEFFNEQSSMTTSQFMEEARYNASIENELAKSIVRISTIQSARVHLATPRQSSFIRNRTPGKASVVVTPFSGRSVSQPQVQAIVNLVASSVPYLASTDVSVVDHNGNLLTNSGTGSLSQATEELTYLRSVEEMYQSRIDGLLTSLLGLGNVSTNVDITMDFTQLESTFEEFDRNGSGPMSRSEMLRVDMSSDTAAEGVPGATTNIAPNDTLLLTNEAATGAETGPGGQIRSSQTTRNYELDRSIRHVKNQTGVISRISMAIAINESALTEASVPQGVTDEAEIATYQQAYLEKLNGLVQAAIGYSVVRGDIINIISSRFRPAEIIENQLAFYEDPSAMSLIKYALGVLLFVLFMLIVIRPVVKLSLPEKPDPLELSDETLNAGDLSPAELAMLTSGDTAGLDEIKAKLRPKKSSISADMLDTANTYDDKVALIRLLVAEDSARVANVLKKLIKPA
jgi:flagellar M-ring protein FliF